jgi:hypothetical protein
VKKVADTIRSSFLMWSGKGNKASANPTQPPGPMPQSPDQDANTCSPSSTSDQVEATMNLGDNDLQLLCIIEGEAEVFPIDVEGPSWCNPKYMVGHLKKIQEEHKDDFRVV